MESPYYPTGQTLLQRCHPAATNVAKQERCALYRKCSLYMMVTLGHIYIGR